MIRTLLARQLRHRRGLLIALAVGLASIEVALIHIMSHFDTGPGLDQLLELIPAFIQDLVATQMQSASFPAAVAFGFQHPAVLVASHAYVFLVATTPAAEREEGLLDLILSRPLHRSQYMLAAVAEIALGAVLCATSVLVGTVVGLATVDIEGELPWTRYVVSAVSLALLLLSSGGLVLLLATGARRRGSAVARGAGLLLSLYVLQMLAELWTGLKWLSWATPFHYFRPIAWAVEPPPPALAPLVLAGIFAVTSAAAFRRFHARDL